MKVAFIARSTLFTVPGGDTRQMVMTAKYLREGGIDVDILLSGQPIDYSVYDLLHFFNIIRPSDIITHVEKSGKPFVISPIFVEYGNINERAKGPVVSIVGKALAGGKLEYLKTMARWLLNGEKPASKKYIWLGHDASVRWLLARAAHILPNSESEMRRFRKAYHTNCPYRVVPNGVDTDVVNHAVKQDPKYNGAVVCIARFEPLKNQLALIKALKGTSYRVYLHGKPSPNNMAYYNQCKEAAGDNIHLEGWLEGAELYKVVGNAKVHVLPSYFETTGLSSLEAAVMGCNIVVTDKGDQRDYFKDDAWYCEPDDPASIRKAVDEAYAAPYNEQFKQRILEQYTWRRAAEETLKAYREVLKD